MTAIDDRRRGDLRPALLAALALHLGLFAFFVATARSPSVSPTGSAVPINIVSSEPTTDSRPAEAAPIAQAAQVETPTPLPKAPAPPPAPAAAARAALERPASKLAPSPTPLPAKTLAKPAPAKPDLNLDALQASIARSARVAPARLAFATRGPTRAETAPQARVDAGQGVSQSDKAGLSELLNRLWNPNCSVEGGDAVTVLVTFTVGQDGRLVGRVSAGGRESSSDPVVFAAARRAIDAVHQAEPYAAVFRRNAFKVNFDAKTACSKR
jgi:outer membrane biosynthesis protein TonB